MDVPKPNQVDPDGALLGPGALSDAEAAGTRPGAAFRPDIISPSPAAYNARSSALFDEAKAVLAAQAAAELARKPRRRPSGLGQALGAVGLLVAAIGATGALFTLGGSDPGSGVVLLAVAVLGAGLFIRAYLADRRWRQVREATIVARPPGHTTAAGDYIALGDARVPGGSSIGQSLRRFLDDPTRYPSISLAGPDDTFIRFRLSEGSPRSLLGEAASDASLIKPILGADGPNGLVALGWATPAPGIRTDFAAEWLLPVDIDALLKVVVSTAKIYGVDEGDLRSSLDADDASDRHRIHFDPASRDPVWLRRLVKRWWGPATWVVAVAIVLVGKDGFGRLLDSAWGSIPRIVQHGLLSAVLFGVSAACIRRNLNTADPITMTGYNRLRGRTVTTYAPHAWWGIIGGVAAIVAVIFLITGFLGGTG